MTARLTHFRKNFLLHCRGGKLRIRIQNKRRCGHLLLVHYGMGAALGDLAQRIVGGSHNHVTAQQQICLTGGNTNGHDIVLSCADPDMAHHGPKLLCQARLVQSGTALTFNVCGHGNQRGNRQYAGTANARHHDIPGPLYSG